MIRLLGLVIAIAVMLPAAAWAGPSPTTLNEDSTIAVDLITISPGDALLTRAGHAALAVVERVPDGREFTTVYNYGDADFSDPWLGPSFAFGQPRFRLSIIGDVYDTAELYGMRQNRTVYSQRLAVSEAQARTIAERLAVGVLPENREYDYHYLERTCTTEIRSLLDDVLGGPIEAQLGSVTDPWTVREYQQLTFDGDIVIALLADAGFGRLHDEPITKARALLWPARMREYLQEVQVPNPEGGGAVPLAGPPKLLAERTGPPATVSPTRITWIVAPIASLAMLGLAVILRRRKAVPSRGAGLWLLAWSLPLGIVGLAIAVLGVASTVPELRTNEVALSLPFTDILLVGPAIAWLRRRPTMPWWLLPYARLRLVLVGAAVAARAGGWFIQEPWIVPVASLVVGIGLWWMLRGRAATLARP